MLPSKRADAPKRAVKPSVVKPPTLKQAKAACLQIHSLIVRHRAGYQCQAAGVIPGECEPPLQCAHIIPKRRNTHINLEPDNGWCLCSKHHILVDQNPAQWLRIVTRYRQALQVFTLQHLQEERREAVRPVSEGGMSATMRYRAELVDLVDFAQGTAVPLTSVPKHILKWVEAQDATKEDARSL